MTMTTNPEPFTRTSQRHRNRRPRVHVRVRGAHARLMTSRPGRSLELLATVVGTPITRLMTRSDVRPGTIIAKVKSLVTILLGKK